MKLDPQSGNSGIFGYNITTLAPVGQVIAVCLDIRDSFGVDRLKFGSQTEKEKQDVTRFLFGFKAPTGQPMLVQTFEFKISGNSGSNLVEFLKAWTNRDPYGFDYLDLKGTGAMLTIGSKASTKNPGKVYNTVGAISPVYPTLVAQIPNPMEFATLVAAALAPPPMSGTTAPPQHYQPPAAPPALQTNQPQLSGQMVWVIQNGSQTQLDSSLIRDAVRIGSVTAFVNPQTNQWQQVTPPPPLPPPPPPLPPPPVNNPPAWSPPPPTPPPTYTPPPAPFETSVGRAPNPKPLDDIPF